MLEMPSQAKALLKVCVFHPPVSFRSIGPKTEDNPVSKVPVNEVIEVAAILISKSDKGTSPPQSPPPGLGLSTLKAKLVMSPATIPAAVNSDSNTKN